MALDASEVQICVIGAGPRGLSVLERLCANERAAPRHAAVTVHVVDPHPAGAGRVWRTGQSRHLLMNTVASQVSVYTDDSAEIAGPVEPGPSLYEWARDLAGRAPSPGGGREAEQVRDEAARLGPDSYPTRALYGQYLKEAFARVVAAAPAHVTVRVHGCRAVALDDAGRPGGPQRVQLEDGTVLDGVDAVVSAQGHVPLRPSESEVRTARAAARLGLRHVRPANPADVDLSGVAPGSAVLLRGLGLNFFDHMALLTAGRGGRFVRAAGGTLVYRASGREPRLYAGSRRGVPYAARGENQKGAHGRHVPRVLTEQCAERLRKESGGRGLGFRDRLWPLIAKEVESVYYGALLAARGRGAERDALVDAYVAARGPAQESAVLDRFGVAGPDRWDWERVARPYGGRTFADRAAFRSWLLAHLAGDLRAARQGNVEGPLKAALDVLRDLRNEIRIAVEHRGLDGASHRDELDGWYTPLNAFLSIGPPAARIEEMAALIEAGVLEVLGPELRVELDDKGPEPAFVAWSQVVPGPRVRAAVLVEARLPEPDLRRTGDPLLHRLLATGQARLLRVPSVAGGYETGGLAVTGRPYRVVDARGTAHPRRFAYGVPTEGVHWVTAAGIRPGVGSVTLGDSDAIARAALAAGRAVDAGDVSGATPVRVAA
ncbi:FAD/NAD(P)-binding protein [Streptomyces sp. NPDC006552]|uniref:FAD/NAD(P)-binding protein n=1 Tax=Streptomyces sp. NPDC006552 TaxID=3157179 RepID=UPI0033BB8051